MVFNFPEWGEMVLAGVPHPGYDREFDESDWAIIGGRACKWFPGYREEDSAGRIDDDGEWPF